MSKKRKQQSGVIQSAYDFNNPLPTISITNDWQEWSAIKKFETHPAVDLSCSMGNLIKAADNGVVFQAGYGAMTIWF